MADNRLEFGAPAAPSVPARMVFGDSGDTPPHVDTTTRLVFDQLSATGLPARLVFGDVDDSGPPTEAPEYTMAGGGRITGLRIRLAAVFDVNVSRPTVAQAAQRYQQATRTHAGAFSAYQQALPANSGATARWQDAQPVDAAVRAVWQDAENLARWARAKYQQAVAVPALPLLQRFEQADNLRSATRTRFEDAERLGVAPTRSPFQEAIHLRALGLVKFEAARPLGRLLRSVDSYALPGGQYLGARYQEAWPPRAGIWIKPPVPQVPDVCYLAELPARLVFSEAGTNGALPPLVFFCERYAGPGPVDPGATVVVPIRKVYVTVNTLTLTRASDGALIPCAAFGMSLDVDSWTWQWQATLHADALPLITPGPGGEPVEVLATVNGTPYRLACEGYTRNRVFANTRIAVRGRGRAAILDAPYAPSLNFGNTADRTAQQLMADVLTINGVGIGWDVDWGLTDWLVPANAWTLQGAYIGGILDIASAAGGYVQPHDTAQTLRILPRYPAAPWDWASLTPDFELPAAVVSVEGTEWQQKPAYNRVYASGTTAGVLGQVTRAGTAGDAVAPMVTHPLITHADAARQRGIAELSDTGRQARLSLRLPVLEETGVIKPGAFVRYVDNGVPTLGLVRGTQVEWSRPTLRQVLDVETHPA